MIGRSSAVAAVCVLLALPACSDSTGPTLSTGAYLLTSVNGQAPPALVGATLTCDQLLATTALSLVADGSFSMGGQLIDDCTRSGGSTTIAVYNLAGTYRASNGNLVLTPAAPGSPQITATYDAAHIRGTIPASPATFPTALAVSFTFYQVPPP
jgi:hypothetical protein